MVAGDGRGVMALISSRNFGRLVTPVARTLTPKYFAGFIRTVLDRAIDGAGPIPGAALSADRLLIETNGSRDAAIRRMIGNHVRIAGAQGLVTNIGGLMTAAAAIPANITGLALVQCHLIAGIAHLRGHHLADPRVRNAVLACMVGEDGLASLRRSGSLSQTPYRARHRIRVRSGHRRPDLPDHRRRTRCPGRREATCHCGGPPRSIAGRRFRRHHRCLAHPRGGQVRRRCTVRRPPELARPAEAMAVSCEPSCGG